MDTRPSISSITSTHGTKTKLSPTPSSSIPRSRTTSTSSSRKSPLSEKPKQEKVSPRASSSQHPGIGQKKEGKKPKDKDDGEELKTDIVKQRRRLFE